MLLTLSQLLGCIAFPREAAPCRWPLRPTSPQRPLPGKCELTPAFPGASRLSAFAGVEPRDPGCQVFFLQRLSALGRRLPALLLLVIGSFPLGRKTKLSLSVVRSLERNLCRRAPESARTQQRSENVGREFPQSPPSWKVGSLPPGWITGPPGWPFLGLPTASALVWKSQHVVAQLPGLTRCCKDTKG